MFISSYMTYIDPSRTKRLQDQREETTKEPAGSFASKPSKTTNQELILSKKLPLSYISNYKTLYTKQRLMAQLEHKNMPQDFAKMKFTKINAQASAQLSYTQNSTMFSLLSKPKATLSQTPQHNKHLPEQAQKQKEHIVRAAMINTYVANENYYRLTAA